MEDIRAVELLQPNPLPDPVQESRAAEAVQATPEDDYGELEYPSASLPYEPGLNLDLFA